MLWSLLLRSTRSHSTRVHSLHPWLLFAAFAWLGACGEAGRGYSPHDAGEAQGQEELDASVEPESDDPAEEVDASQSSDADVPDDAAAQEQDSALQMHDAGFEDAASSDGGAGTGQHTLGVRLGAANASTRVTQVIAAPAGDLLLVGHTNGTIDPAGRRGAMDALVVRMRSDGSVVWARQLGDVGIGPGLVVKAWDAALSAQGELIVVGLVNGRPSFYGQPLTATFTGFVAAFGADGEQRWLRLLSAVDGTSEAMGVEVLQDGRIAVAGYTKSSALFGAQTLGAGDVFVSWFSGTGEVLRTRRYGAATEEYPTAFTARGNDLYLAFKTAPIGGTPTALSVVRLDATGDERAALALEEPQRREIVGLAPTDAGVCAGLQLLDVTDAGQASTEYGLRCYDESLRQLRALRGGTPGGRSAVQTIACQPDGRCVLAGYADGWFEGEPLDAAVEAFVLGFAPDDTRLFAKRFAAPTGPDQDSVARVSAAASLGSGRFVLAGDANGALFGPRQGNLDAFVTDVE